MRVLHSAIARGPQAITSHLHSCTLVLHAAQRTKRHLQSAEPPSTASITSTSTSTLTLHAAASRAGAGPAKARSLCSRDYQCFAA